MLASFLYRSAYSKDFLSYILHDKTELLGSYHFLPGGGSVCLWRGGAKIFWGGLREGPKFSIGSKRGTEFFHWSKRGAEYKTIYSGIFIFYTVLPTPQIWEAAMGNGGTHFYTLLPAPHIWEAAMGSGGAQYRHGSQVLVLTLKMIAQIGLVNQALLPPCLVYSGSKKKVLKLGGTLKKSREQGKTWKGSKVQEIDSANKPSIKNLTKRLFAQRSFCLILKRWLISWITGQNVQMLQIFAVFASTSKYP